MPCSGVMESCHFIGGPEVAALEEEVARYSQARARRRVRLGHRRAAARAVDARHRPRRRGHLAGLHVLRHRRHDREQWRDAGVRGRGSAHLQPRRAPARSGHHAAHQGGRGGVAVRPVLRPAGHQGDLRQAPALPDRGRGAVDRLGVGGQALRLEVRLRHVLVLPVQEPGRRRRRRHDRHAATPSWPRRPGCSCNHGAKPKYYHSVVGTNSRLDALQAAILRVKLQPPRPLEREAREERRALQRAVRRLAASAGRTTTRARATSTTSTSSACPKRDELKKHLGEKNIGCEVYYPVPLHLQKCFAHLGYKAGDMPHLGGGGATRRSRCRSTPS